MSTLKKIALLCACLAGASSIAAPINMGSYGFLAGSHVVSFNELAAHFEPGNPAAMGTAHEGVVVVDGVGFGEHFSGQVLGRAGDFDVISGLPAGPLELRAGAAGQNLFAMPAGVIDLPNLKFDNVLAGVGPLGATSTAGVGEGAISIIFSSDQSQFGLQLIGLTGGGTSFSFFRGDGSLVQTITAYAANNAYLGFFREGGIKDIRGVSIWNDDNGGMSIDNVKHDVASSVSAVPEPSSAVMLLAGALLVCCAVRRRSAAA